MSRQVLGSAFGARVIFLFEKQSKAYTQYDAESIAEEKFAIAQKQLQSSQLSWTAGSSGA